MKSIPILFFVVDCITANIVTGKCDLHRSIFFLHFARLFSYFLSIWLHFVWTIEWMLELWSHKLHPLSVLISAVYVCRASSLYVHQSIWWTLGHTPCYLRSQSMTWNITVQMLSIIHMDTFNNRILLHWQRATLFL